MPVCQFQSTITVGDVVTDIFGIFQVRFQFSQILCVEEKFNVLLLVDVSTFLAPTKLPILRVECI